MEILQVLMLHWDTSADDLIFNGAAGLIVPDGQLL